MTTTTRKIARVTVDRPVKAKRTPKPKRKDIDNLSQWSHGYVGLAAMMSMVLNAMANCQHSEQKVLSAVMGGLIPVLVLLLGRVAGLLYRRKKERLAYAVGGIGVVLLLLSVFHCTESIAMLTGSNWIISAALAIGIDCGLVACEVVAVVED